MADMCKLVTIIYNNLSAECHIFFKFEGANFTAKSFGHPLKFGCVVGKLHTFDGCSNASAPPARWGNFFG